MEKIQMVNFGLGKNIIRSCLINSTQKSYLWVISPKYFCSWSLVIRKPVPKFADQLWGSAQIKNFGIKCSVVGSPVGSKWLSFVKCLKNIIKNNLIFTSTIAKPPRRISVESSPNKYQRIVQVGPAIQKTSWLGRYLVTNMSSKTDQVSLLFLHLGTSSVL